MLITLVSAETILLLLVVILVLGLLRSYAEVLHRLEASSANNAGGLPFIDTGRVAPPVEGTSLSGQRRDWLPSKSGSMTLMAFLSSGCAVCETFWQDFKEDPTVGGAIDSVLIVTKSQTDESLSALSRLAPATDLPPLIMSTKAWEEYGVVGSPYFVLVDEKIRRVVGEGTGNSLRQVLSLLRDAVADQSMAQTVPSWKSESVDERLAQSGIGPGHPSLYDNT